jgi:hypothetical protein
VSNPWCNVVIDHRPGVGQIAIEHSKAFGTGTSKVRDLLLTFFRVSLKPYGLDIQINAKTRTAGFWDTVEWQCRERHDTVKRVVLDFPNPKNAEPLDAPDEMKERLNVLAGYLCAFGAVRGSLHIDAEKNGTLSVDKKNEDLARMMVLCGNNGYNIAVHFSKMGVYRYGERTMAMIQMDEKTLTDFADGQEMIADGEEGTFALIRWLDDIREQTKNYDNAKPTPKKRKRTREEKISDASALSHPVCAVQDGRA